MYTGRPEVQEGEKSCESTWRKMCAEHEIEQECRQLDHLELHEYQGTGSNNFRGTVKVGNATVLLPPLGRAHTSSGSSLGRPNVQRSSEEEPENLLHSPGYPVAIVLMVGSGHTNGTWVGKRADWVWLLSRACTMHPLIWPDCKWGGEDSHGNFGPRMADELRQCKVRMRKVLGCNGCGTAAACGRH